MRLLAIGLAIALIVFALTAGHVIFLPLLFVPFGLVSFGQRRRRGAGPPPRRGGEGGGCWGSRGPHSGAVRRWGVDVASGQRLVPAVRAARAHAAGLSYVASAVAG